MDEKEFIISVVQQHIYDNTFYMLPKIFNDPEVKKLASQISFGWPDFLDPYVKDFANKVKRLDYRDISFREYEDLLRQYDDIASVCLSLGLSSSFGYLRNSVCEDLIDLRRKCVEAFRNEAPVSYTEWSIVRKISEEDFLEEMDKYDNDIPF